MEYLDSVPFRGTGGQANSGLPRMVWAETWAPDGGACNVPPNSQGNMQYDDWWVVDATVNASECQPELSLSGPIGQVWAENWAPDGGACNVPPNSRGNIRYDDWWVVDADTNTTPRTTPIGPQASNP